MADTDTSFEQAWGDPIVDPGRTHHADAVERGEIVPAAAFREAREPAVEAERPADAAEGRPYLPWYEWRRRRSPGTRRLTADPVVGTPVVSDAGTKTGADVG